MLRWGICGAGNICFDFANALALGAGRHRVQAVACRELKRAQQFAAQFKIENAYSQYADLARDPNIDAVYIGTVNNTHFELSKMFLEAGKPVLCEKALCCGLPQAEALIEVAQSRGVFLMEGLWHLLLPAADKLRQLLAEKAIGTVRAIDARVMINRTHLERITDSSLGGGVMWFTGVYSVSLVDMIFGGELPKSVHVVGAAQNGVDVDVCAAVQFSEGRYASLMHSASLEGDLSAGHAGFTLFGDGGYIRLLEIGAFPNRIEVVKKEGMKETDRQTYEFKYPQGPYPNRSPNTGGFVHEADHVRDCLMKGLKQSPIIPLETSFEFKMSWIPFGPSLASSRLMLCQSHLAKSLPAVLTARKASNRCSPLRFFIDCRQMQVVENVLDR